MRKLDREHVHEIADKDKPYLEGNVLKNVHILGQLKFDHEYSLNSLIRTHRHVIMIDN